MNNRDDLQIMQKAIEDNQKKFKSFLESYSLYRKFREGPSTLRPIDCLPLHLLCSKCDLKTTHSFSSDLSNLKQSPISPKPMPTGLTIPYPKAMFSTYTLVYGCEQCRKSYYYFQVSFEDGHVLKTGQYPSAMTDIDGAVKKKLGENLASLYQKGKICESHGLGIASMSYYRRVVEEKVFDILNEAKDFAPTGEEKKFEDFIENIKKEHSFEKKADFIKNSLPKIIVPDGENLLKLLFGVISKGLHSKSDDECLAMAKDVSSLLEAVIHALNSQAETMKTVAEVSKRLKDQYKMG